MARSFHSKEKIMKRYLFAAIIVMLVTVGFSSEASAQKFSKVVTDAARWQPVAFEAPDACTGGAEECALEVLGDLNISVGDKPDFSVYQLGETDGKDVTVVFVSHLPEENDSVLGNLYRLELSRDNSTEKSFRLEALGRMYQCMEGPIGWRKTNCP